jgi:hypothetical protein
MLTFYTSRRSKAKRDFGQQWWCTSVIPAIREAKIVRIMVQGQSRQKVIENPPQPTSQAWWCVSVVTAMWEVEIGGL